jgi:hypothetical protein
MEGFHPGKYHGKAWLNLGFGETAKLNGEGMLAIVVSV